MCKSSPRIHLVKKKNKEMKHSFPIFVFEVFTQNTGKYENQQRSSRNTYRHFEFELLFMVYVVHKSMY